MNSDDEERVVQIITDLTFYGDKHHFMIMVPSTATFQQIMEIAEEQHNLSFKNYPHIKASNIEFIVGGTRRSKIIDMANITLQAVCSNNKPCHLFPEAKCLEPAVAPAKLACHIHDAMKEAATKSNEDLILEATEAYEASAEFHNAMKEAATKSNEDLIREATEAYEASAKLHNQDYDLLLDMLHQSWWVPTLPLL